MKWDPIIKKENDEARKKEECLKRLNPEKCYLAIKWLKEKIAELGVTIENEQKFNEEIMDFIKESFVKIGGTAVLSSAETLFTKKNGMRSLEDIFRENNVDIGDYIFSMTITSTEVLVVDGKGNARKRLEYDSKEECFKYFSLKRSRTIVEF